jgi:hypothetical protein
MSNQPIEKATLYMRDDLWAYSKTEVSNLTWAHTKYAQFPNAVKLEFTERGKRKRANAVITTIPAVVLDGWEHPAPPPKFSAQMEGGKTVKAPSKGGYSIQEARFGVRDERWDVEFDAFLDSHIEKSNAKVLLDLRTHDPMKVD